MAQLPESFHSVESHSRRSDDARRVSFSETVSGRLNSRLTNRLCHGGDALRALAFAQVINSHLLNGRCPAIFVSGVTKRLVPLSPLASRLSPPRASSLAPPCDSRLFLAAPRSAAPSALGDNRYAIANGEGVTRRVPRPRGGGGGVLKGEGKGEKNGRRRERRGCRHLKY